MQSFMASGSELQLLWAFVSVVIFVVLDMGHFHQGRAKLRELPQIALGLSGNLRIFVTECIFDFLNSMCTSETGRQSYAIVGRHRDCFGPGITTNINSISKTNSSSKPLRMCLYSLQIS